MVHTSIGDYLRADVSAGTNDGKKAQEFMNVEKLVPDETVTAVWTTLPSRITIYLFVVLKVQADWKVTVFADGHNKIIASRC